jgi:hypothetical protein
VKGCCVFGASSQNFGAKLRQSLTNPDVKAEYERPGPAFAVVGK